VFAMILLLGMISGLPSRKRRGRYLAFAFFTAASLSSCGGGNGSTFSSPPRTCTVKLSMQTRRATQQVTVDLGTITVTVK
jgi:hypothetical protein